MFSPHKMFWTQGLRLLPIVHRIQHAVDALNPVSSQDSDKDSVSPWAVLGSGVYGLLSERAYYEWLFSHCVRCPLENDGSSVVSSYQDNGQVR